VDTNVSRRYRSRICEVKRHSNVRHPLLYLTREAAYTYSPLLDKRGLHILPLLDKRGLHILPPSALRSTCL
jgi:hypothetical protein